MFTKDNPPRVADLRNAIHEIRRGRPIAVSIISPDPKTFQVAFTVIDPARGPLAGAGEDEWLSQAIVKALDDIISKGV